MFYTLSSKIPLIPSGKNHFLIVFIVGSLAYIVLNYYLYSENAPAFVDSYKSYVYFLMILDLAIAYFLSKGTHNAEDEQIDGYTKEQKKQIEDDLMALRNSKRNQANIYTQRAMQLNQEKINQSQFEAKNKQCQNNNNDDDNESDEVGSNKSPFKTIDEVEEDDRKAKLKTSIKKTTTSSSSSEESEKKQNKTVKTKSTQQKKKKNTTDEDTDIPVYGI